MHFYADRGGRVTCYPNQTKNKGRKHERENITGSREGEVDGEFQFHRELKGGRPNTTEQPKTNRLPDHPPTKNRERVKRRKIEKEKRKRKKPNPGYTDEKFACPRTSWGLIVSFAWC